MRITTVKEHVMMTHSSQPVEPEFDINQYCIVKYHLRLLTQYKNQEVGRESESTHSQSTRYLYNSMLIFYLLEKYSTKITICYICRFLHPKYVYLTVLFTGFKHVHVHNGRAGI